MSSNTRSKRRNERRTSSKTKKEHRVSNAVVSENTGHDVFTTVPTAILEETVVKETCQFTGEMYDAHNIDSQSLLCLEESYDDPRLCTSRPLSPMDMWVPESSNMSLIIGGEPELSVLYNQIVSLTHEHQIQMTSQDEAFEVCNKQSYLLIWLLMAVPAAQDILSLTTSIRYASKCNRGTVLIGVATSPSTVDLRLHGIDEVVIQPVSNLTIKQKYSKWTSVELVPEDIENLKDLDSHLISTPTTPATPLTPLTPDTPTTPISTSDNNSHFSLSLDSGIESLTSTPQMTPEQINSAFSGLSSLQTPISAKRKPQSVVADHTTKEKLRRERIKDSCDQLRVLLPYIRGRKTDMASILEMCVDYLKIVNAALPQEFQTQIVEILSKETTEPCARPRGNSASKKVKRGSQFTESPSANLVSSTVESDQTGLEASQTKSESGNFTLSKGEAESTSLKRDLSKTHPDMKSSKRFCHQPMSELGTVSPALSPVALAPIQTLPSFENIKISRQDSSAIDQPNSPYPYNTMHMPHTSLYDYDSTIGGRLLNTSHDAFSTATYFNQSLPTKQTNVDRSDTFGLYLDTQSLYQYYGNNNMTGSYNVSRTSVPDYVNPNSVLPVSYHEKLKQEAQKYEEQSNIVTTGSLSPVMSASDISVTK